MKKRNKITFGYFLRGLGIGILFTTIICIIHTNRLQKEYTPLSQEEIIEKAKEYGMVEALDQTLDALEKEENNKAQSTPAPATELPTTSSPENEKTESNMKEDNTQDKEDNKVTLERIEIEKGDSLKEVARKLKEVHIIEDEGAFKEYFNRKKLGSKVMIGTYNIPIGYSYSDIAKLITR